MPHSMNLEMNLLENIWQQYSSKLLLFIRTRVSDPSEAEDILQDVFVKTLSKADGIYP